MFPVSRMVAVLFGYGEDGVAVCHAAWGEIWWRVER